METIIQTLDFKARKTLTDLVEECVGKLEAHSDRIISCRVILMLKKSDQQENKVCELRLAVPGHEFFASKECEKFEDAVLKATEAVKHQMERLKEAKVHKVNTSSISLEETDETE
jgi:putative sigma-54 modulation protein